MAKNYITSRHNEKIKSLAKLHHKKYREASGDFMLMGGQAIMTAVEANRPIKEIFYTPDAEKLLPKFLGRSDIKPDLYAINESVAMKLSERDNPLGVFARLPMWDASLSSLTDLRTGLYLGLDRLRDPGNLGTIIRTLMGLDGKGVILVGDSVDVFSVEANRASMGALCHCEIYHASEEEFIDWAEKMTATITATAIKGGRDARALSYPLPHLLLLGNEQQGLSPALLALADQVAVLPLGDKIESYNVASAGAMMMLLMQS